MGVAGALFAPASLSAEPRRFTFEYEATIGPVGAGAGPVDVFVPLAAENAQQRVRSEEIVASIPGAISVEDAYGNRFWHGRIENASQDLIKVSVRTQVERRITKSREPTESRGLRKEGLERFAPFLQPNRRVVVDHPILAPIRKEIRARAGGEDPAQIARAIYDWIVENVEYKKVGSGWGNGDTFWACTERYGNCTDFHALFISLARSEGIPARFEIGFPVPEDRPSGMVGGYHCWVEFYLPETGWFPVDASEAFKHPERKEFLYGGHPHGILPEGEPMVGVMALTQSGLGFETPDGRPVHCMVLLGTASDERDRHLQVLAALARTVGTDRAFGDQLFDSKSPAHAYELLHGEESEDFNYFMEEALEG